MNQQPDILRTDEQGVIQFETLKELHNAVLVYGGEGEQNARKDNIEAIGERHGGLAGALFEIATGGNKKGFAQKVVQEIGSLNQRYSGSWDYDGPGPFFKANLDAERQEDGKFTLEIRVSYYGNDPEIVLAKQLGAPIGYHRCTIKREYPASDDGRFRIPLSDVIDVYRAVGQDIDEKAAFDVLTTKVENKKLYKQELPGAVAVSSDDEVIVTIGFDSYTVLDSYDESKSPDRDLEYRLEDGCLTGPAREGFDVGYRAVKLAVNIQPQNGPTYDQGVEQRIRKIGDGVEKIWRGNNAPKSELGLLC